MYKGNSGARGSGGGGDLRSGTRAPGPEKSVPGPQQKFQKEQLLEND